MRTLVLLVVGVLTLAACGEPEPSDNTTGWPSPDGDWQLSTGINVIPNFPITISIDGTEVSGRAACNSYFGTVEVNGSSLAIGQLGWTEMACEPDVMEAEGAFLEALGTITSFRYDNNSLVLISESDDLRFDPVAPTPLADLIGTEWTLETLIEGETAASVTGGPATLLLNTDGTLQASTGCRTLTGRWLDTGATIVVPDLSADGECPDDLWKQDSLVVTVIEDEFRAEIDGDRLTLSSMGGDALVYRTGR